MKNTFKLLLTALLFFPIFVFAASLSYIPRFYAAGFGGYDKALVGKADILAPIYLAADKNLFAYAQGKSGYENQAWEDNTWTGSFALGYRQIVKDATVLGAYVFGDYTTSTSGHNFWVISPGIESLGRAWEFRANGYFPVSDTRWVDKGWAEEFGDYHYVKLTQHQQWDHVYKYYQETGAGADAEAGRTIYKFKNILFKAYLNGYYYYMQHNDDVTGGGARLTIEPNRSLKLSLHYSYDNYVHSTFLAGVQLSFYDLFTDNRNAPVDQQDLQRNLFVPIERNLGTIGSGSSIPVTRGDTAEDAGRALVHDNIWFFKPDVAASNAVQGDGTYEKPFIGLTPDNFNFVNTNYNNIGATIDPLPLLYFARGNYPITGFTPTSSRVIVPDGWSMYGWAMYNTTTIHPAMNTERPLFTGGLQLGNNTSINNLQLQNSTSTPLTEGVFADGTSNITFDNVMVGTATGGTISDYTFGIYFKNSFGGVTINNSQIYGNNYGLLVVLNTNVAFSINGINNSIFKSGAEAVRIFRTFSADGVININNINNSNFSGGNIGLKVQTVNNAININNISNSNFTGGILGGLFLLSGTGAITVNNISNSAFNGVTYGVQITNNTGAVAVSDINNSSFMGGVSGFRIDTVSGAIGVSNINNSNFTGNGGNGFTAHSINNVVYLTNITNNNFSSLSAGGFGMWLGGTSVTVDGITDVATIYNNLLAAGNNFIVVSGKRLNINGTII